MVFVNIRRDEIEHSLRWADVPAGGPDGHELTQYDPDVPCPDLGDIGRNSFRSMTDSIKAEARERG